MAEIVTMVGKICLVTGATAGIGFITARELARMGATVVLVGRNKQKCEKAVAYIRSATGNNAVEYLVADLSSQSNIRRLVREYLSRHSRLNVLINNAGALFAHRQESVDGIEMTLALNHLSYFLLTTLLLDTLQASAPCRIVNVSSHAHEMVTSFNFEDPQMSRTGLFGYNRSEPISAIYTLFAPMVHPALLQYARSKLANLLFAYELAMRLEGTGVTVNSLHPGFVHSSFMMGNGTLGAFMRLWAILFGISAEEGAKTSIYLASASEVEGITGKHFMKCQPTATSPASNDEIAAKRLWLLSEKLTSSKTSAQEAQHDQGGASGVARSQGGDDVPGTHRRDGYRGFVD
ncbi:MAG: SDR family oxidoreductase [Gemmatales bacterium]